MPDKKLEKLKKLLEVANQDFATPEEVAKMAKALIDLLKRQRTEIDEKLSSVKDLTESQAKTLAQDLSTKETRLQSLIDSLQAKLKDAESRVQKSIDDAEERVTKKIPKRVDLTDIRNEIQALKDSLPNFATLITMEPEAIRDALELLQDEERLDASAIKNLDQYATKQVTGGGWGVVRRLSNLDDVNVQTTRPNENATIQYQTASGKWFTGVSITVSQTAPTDPKTGDLWVALP